MWNDTCKLCLSARGLRGTVLWEDALWAVCHKSQPCGVVGHCMLISKRHIQGPSTMSDEEAASLGLVLRRCERALERATGCDRVYTAALGSAQAPHFHAHMMPVYTEAGGLHGGSPAVAATGTPWDVFLQEKLAKEGKAKTDQADCDAAAAAFAREVAKLEEEERVVLRSETSA